MENVIGKEMASAIFEFSEEFNKLKLTNRELALLFPLALTSHGIQQAFFNVII